MLTILNIIGFIREHWRSFAIALCGCLLATMFLGLVRSCNRPPKINEKEIQKAQEAIAKRDRAEMIEVLAKSEADEKQIDANAMDASGRTANAVSQARRQVSELTNEELAREIERRLNQ